MQPLKYIKYLYCYKFGKLLFDSFVFNQAKDYYVHALMLCEKLFGPDHSKVAYIYRQLGLVYRELGNYKKALRSVSESMFRNMSQKNDKAVGIDMNVLAIMNIELGENDTAYEYLKKALDYAIKYDGPVSLSVANSEMNHGLYFCEKDLYGIAIEWYNKAEIIYKEIFTYYEKDTYYAKLCMSKSCALRLNNQLDESLKYAEWAKQIYEYRFKSNHPMKAMSYDTLALVYVKKGKIKEAIELHKKSIEMLETIYGGTNYRVANVYHNIGQAYIEDNNFKKAKESLENCLHIYHFLGEGNFKIKDYVKKTEELLNNLPMEVIGNA